MEQAAFHFAYIGTPVSCELYGSGHINRTFLIGTDTGAHYILQRLSSVAFHDIPGLMSNIIRVTKHIAAKDTRPDSTLHFVPSDNGEYYYLDGEGAYWRSYRFVEAICIQLPETPDDFYQSAVAFGNFQNQLSDFPRFRFCQHNIIKRSVFLILQKFLNHGKNDFATAKE